MNQPAHIKRVSIILGVAILVVASLVLWRIAFQVDGEVSSNVLIDTTSFGGDIGSSDRIGTDMANIGDLDNNGEDDFAIGTEAASSLGGFARGSVDIYFMETDGSIKSVTRIANGEGGLVNPVLENEMFGISVAGLGDLDSDGNEDIIVGSLYRAAPAGGFRILLLNANGTVKTELKYSTSDVNGSGLLHASRSAVGAEVANIGDIDGDGVIDVAIGAPFDTSAAASGATRNGSVLIVNLNANGTLKNSTIIDGATTNFVATENYWQFGTGIAGMGDMDGDSVPDIIVSAPGEDTLGTDKGALFTIFLNSDSSVKGYMMDASGDASATSQRSYQRAYASTMANIGDIDGDGVNDLVVGAGFRGTHSEASPNPGGYHQIHLMNANGTIKSSTFYKGTEFSGNVQQMIQAVAYAGDRDSDGNPEILVASIIDSTKGHQSGAFYRGEISSSSTISETIKFTDPSVASYTEVLGYRDYFGRSVANIGDLNGDGVTDLAVGTYSGESAASEGAVFILFMNVNGTVGSHTIINGDDVADLGASDGFGSSMDSLGDFNGDGIPDLLVGVNGDDDGGTNRGAIYILYLDADGTLDDTTPYKKISSLTGAVGGGGIALNGNGFAGEGLASIGDLDSNGTVDFAVGIPYLDDGNTDTGGIVVLLMNASGEVISEHQISNTSGNLSYTPYRRGYLGSSIEGIGDLDGDGIVDIAVGERASELGGRDRGAVHILFMNADATVKTNTSISDLDDDIILANYNGFGRSIANIGDLNADGVTDLAVGTVDYAGNGTGSQFGAMLIVFLDSGGNAIGSQAINNAYGSLGFNYPQFTYFAQAVAPIGDFNGDGVLDVAVGMSQRNLGAHGSTGNVGAVSLLFLDGQAYDPDPPTLSSSTITTTGATINSVSLAWTKAADTVSAEANLTYKVYYGADGTNLSSVANIESNGTLSQTTADISSATVSSLTGETEYEFAVIASDEAGNRVAYTALGSPTSDLPDVTSPTPGASGVILQDEAATTEQTLSWTVSTDDKTAEGSLVYRLYQAEEGVDLSTVELTESNGTLVATLTGVVTYLHTGLTQNTVYAYNVIVSDVAENKALYTEGEFTTASRLKEAATFPENTQVLLNGGATCTSSLDVSLDIQGKNVDRLVISNNNRFLGSFWELFSGSPMQRTWTLLEEEGEQSIFVVFRSWHGNKSYIHKSTISYEPGNPNCTALAVEFDEDTGEETVTIVVGTEASTEVAENEEDTTETTTDTVVEEVVEEIPEEVVTVEEIVEEVVTVEEIVEEVVPEPVVFALEEQDHRDLVKTYMSNASIVKLDGRNQYRYVSSRGIAYDFYGRYTINTWAAYGATVTKTVSIYEWNDMLHDSNKVIGPLPGTAMQVSGGDYWIVADGPSPLDVKAYAFKDRSTVRGIFGRSFRAYQVRVRKNVSKIWDIQPEIIDAIDQFKINVGSLRKVGEYRSEEIQ